MIGSTQQFRKMNCRIAALLYSKADRRVCLLIQQIMFISDIFFKASHLKKIYPFTSPCSPFLSKLVFYS